MKIGIVSDTHRNRTLLEAVVTWLQEKHHISALYHLGDDYGDVEELADSGLEIVQVPGIYDEKYRNGTLPAKIIEHVLGLRIMLVHSFEKDFTDADRAHADMVLFGHTHKPEIRIEDGFLLMNPGHLKSEMDKHIKPSFGLLDIQDEQVTGRLFGVDFKTLESVDLVRSGSGLYRS